MKVYEYESYEEYKKIQIDANIKKLKNVWCSPATLKQINTLIPDANSILCHGARNGSEVRWFKDLYPQAEVIGTDISYTANDFPDMVEWDFHEVNDEWVGKFDIVYSNSFDHSYDPEKCLTTWVGQLSENGVLCVELMVGVDNASSAMDPLQINRSEFNEIIDKLGYEETDIFYTQARHGNSRTLVCKRK